MIKLKKDGNPFPTEQAARIRKAMLKKEGTDTEIVEVDDGWGLRAIEGGDTKKGRKPRISIGKRSVLSYPEIPGFKTRVVNDDDEHNAGRVKMFEDAWWEVVREPNTPGDDQRVQDASQMGSVVGKPVGGGTRGVLMKIPIELYEEDQKEKHLEIDRAEEGLRLRKDQAPEGEYGSVNIQ